MADDISLRENLSRLKNKHDFSIDNLGWFNFELLAFGHTDRTSKTNKFFIKSYYDNREFYILNTEDSAFSWSKILWDINFVRSSTNNENINDHTKQSKLGVSACYSPQNIFIEWYKTYVLHLYKYLDSIGVISPDLISVDNILENTFGRTFNFSGKFNDKKYFIFHANANSSLISTPKKYRITKVHVLGDSGLQRLSIADSCQSMISKIKIDVDVYVKNTILCSMIFKPEITVKVDPETQMITTYKKEDKSFIKKTDLNLTFYVSDIIMNEKSINTAKENKKPFVNY